MGGSDEDLLRITLEDRAYFQCKIINWYKSHGRRFPWRETHDPYLILIAEIMLQRTRAEQVLPIYESFITKYPNIYKLAFADAAIVKSHFNALGLQKRSDFLMRLCDELINRYDGNIPADYESLRKLPCIGPYTANALMAFGFNKPRPIVDSNVIRIFNRFFNLGYSKHKPNKGIMILSEILVDKNNIRDYNYGILDLASLVCSPIKKPQCRRCPLMLRCLVTTHSVVF